MGNGTSSFVNWTDKTGASVGTDAKKTLKSYYDYNLTAHFSECVVTFNKNGGDTDADPKSSVVPIGTTVSAPTTNPTRNNYIFDGWFKESTCNNSWHFDNDTVPGNTTLYAKWTPVQHVTDVTLNLTAKTLDKNGTVTLTADVTPSDSTYPDITWSSSDESVATVDSNGKVTAVGAGTATITATANGKQSTCLVSVTGQVQQKITVTGTLLDDDRNPLAGYTVELHSTPRTTVTDAKGRYSFADVEIADHSLTLKDKSGATLKSFSIAVKTGDDFNWSEPDDNSITVVVQDDTASIDVTIKLNKDGDVTVEKIKNIVNPLTGDRLQCLMWVFVVFSALIVFSVLLLKKRSLIN